MPFGTLSLWPVLVAAIASFLFGAAWYGLLGRHWMAAAGIEAAEMERRKAAMGPIPLPYVIAFVSLVVMAWIFAGVLLHLSLGGMAISVRAGLISGFLLWLGFVVTTMAVNHAFQGATRLLTLIDGGHWLGVLLVQGAVLGWWGIS
jgi:hypothetical protein